MDALAVDAQLLRAVLTPELNLSVGRVLSVRVAELLPGGRGVLSLAGVLLEAELPKELEAGQELRLVVREVTPERVVLSVAGGDSQAAPVTPAVPVPLELPGGGSIHVTRRDERDSSGSSGGPSAPLHTLALTYVAPHLGAVDMHFTLDPASLQLALTLAAGRAFELADGAAGELQSTLSNALDRPVSVSVQPRREPLDIYA
jgi:hypothetical protein